MAGRGRAGRVSRGIGRRDRTADRFRDDSQPEQMPREKALESGIEALDDHELLALLLRDLVARPCSPRPPPPGRTRGSGRIGWARRPPPGRRSRARTARRPSWRPSSWPPSAERPSQRPSSAPRTGRRTGGRRHHPSRSRGIACWPSTPAPACSVNRWSSRSATSMAPMLDPRPSSAPPSMPAASASPSTTIRPANRTPRPRIW